MSKPISKAKPKAKAKTKADDRRAVAVAFSRLANESMTPEQRTERARKAANARYNKTKQPVKRFGLVALPADFVWRGTRAALPFLDQADGDNPTVINLETDSNKPARYWTPDRAEVLARARRKDLADRVTWDIERDYDPTALRVSTTSKPDKAAQVKAVQDVLGGQK